MYSYSYKHKARFYATLDIDIDTRKLLKRYNQAKDLIMKNETVYFVKKEIADNENGKSKFK